MKSKETGTRSGKEKLTGAAARVGMAVVLAGGAASLAGCEIHVGFGDEKGASAAPTPGLTTAPKTGSPAASGLGERPVMLTFDDRVIKPVLAPSGSEYIKVYNGPGFTPYDQGTAGSFKDGDKVGAECKVLNSRRITTDTDLGESAYSSGSWVRIDSPIPGKDMYATMTYVENPDALLAQLPKCPLMVE